MIISIGIGCIFASCGEKTYPGPVPPAESLQHFRLADQFEVELFAAEPVVTDPTAMIFDETGRIYVVEMPDYPFRPGPGTGNIKQLFDRDGDGRVDSSAVFADGITDATSILPWKGGLLVTAAPHILYMKDTDGDGKADKKEKLFSGFFDENQESQITSLRFNIDNWVYATNRGQSGDIQFNREPESPPLSLQGADFRFRLDTGEYERATGSGQFGQAFDQWGYRYVTQNTVHIRQMVIPYRYLHRHPYLPSTEGLENINDHGLRMYQLTDPPYWRAERTRRRNKRYEDQHLDRVEYAADHFTGSSGGTYYGADLFPEAYRGSIFTGDVAGSLVHRDHLLYTPDQVVSTARRPEKEKNKEFLASTDPWFRPANFTVGPKGALYVIDYYRQHVETPLSIPEDLKEDMDFFRGDKKGRIYRITPKDQSVRGVPDQLKEPTSSKRYVQWLTHPNQWFRLQGQRMLLERQDRSVLPAVEDLFKSHTNPVVRLHALYVLEGMDALTGNVVRNALQDEAPGVQKRGLILAERFPQTLPDVLRLSQDSSMRVVLQAALSLGAFEQNPKVTETLAKILQEHYDNKWIRRGVLSSTAGSSIPLLQQLTTTTEFFSTWDHEKRQFMQDFAYVTGARHQQQDMKDLLRFLSAVPAENQKAGLKGFSGGVKNSDQGVSPDLQNRLEAIMKGGDQEVKDIISNMLKS